MFFRRKRTQSGQVVKLLESYRDAQAKPRHRTVVSLGNAPIPWTERRGIAKAVERELYGQGELFASKLSEEAHKWVDRILRQVSSEGRYSPCKAPRAEQQSIDAVLCHQVSHTQSAPLGPVLVGWEVWKRLGMPTVLMKLGYNPSQRQAAAISVINRLVDPVSEHGLLGWYRRSGLADLMGSKLRGAGDDRFYRVSDRLWRDQQRLEEHLRQAQSSLFNLQRTVVLYDLTNTHFEGLCAGNAKAQRGANKQKRNDCLQIVVAMVFDQYGFEMAHEIFEGSMNESKSVVGMIEELNRLTAPGEKKPIVVMDAGVASTANLQLLREHRFGYLVNDSRRQRGRYAEQFGELNGFRKIETAGAKEPVWVRVMDDPYEQAEGQLRERVVLCKSQSRASKEQAIYSAAEQRWLQDLDKLARRIEKNQLVDPSKIERAIGRMQSRHSRVNRYYRIELKEQSGRAELTYKRDHDGLEQAADLHGCYVLRTDERTLNEYELWRLYMSLTGAEAGFKILKSNLGLRPNRHQIEPRVEGHIFICILAYHLLRHIGYRLEQRGDRRSWETLKRILKTHCYTTILLPTKEGTLHRIRKAGHPEQCKKAIYEALGICWRGLPTHRSVLKLKSVQTNPPESPTTL